MSRPLRHEFPPRRVVPQVGGATRFAGFSWLISAVVLALCLTSAEGLAQQAQPDPWQYPKLTNRKAFQRWWHAFQQRAYPLDDIPSGARERALGEISRLKALRPPSQAVPGNSWINIGPAPILGGQIGATGNARPMSGRVGHIAVHPTDPNHWLIGGAQGGVWRTLDGAATWTPLTDAQASLAMGAIAFAPSNPNIIYAGTGEAVFSGDAYAGAGLLKSTDGGSTWTLLATSTFAKRSFSDIKIHPTDPNIVLAATSSGIAGRGADFPPSPPSTGIRKSTDGGATWSLRLSGQATDLEVHPSNFNNQYAGIGEIFGSASNGVYRSTDAGETWTLVAGSWSTMTGGVGRVELAIAPSNPNVLYVSIQDAFNGAGDDGGLLGLFRTDNAWDPTPTWTQIPTGATDNGTGIHGYCGWDRAFASDSDQCWYDHDLIVDPSDPDTLYAGGIPLWKCTSCTAAEATWTEVSKTAADPFNGIHVDQHALAWAGSRLIVGNDGGVWSTTDGGATWSHHNTGLAITQFYDGSIHPTDPSFALGGSQDNGTEKWTGMTAWQWIASGDGAASAIAASNPNTHWAVSSQNLRIRRTTDGGASFIVATSGIDFTGVPFIARFEKCPANDDVFIAGTNNIWRSNNFFSGVSPTWSNNLSGNFSSGITALAFAPSDSTCSTYAFGTGAGSLRLTFNGGSTWVNIDAGNAVPNRTVTDLAFDPANANVLYVTLSGFDEGTPGQPGHVFKTTNALAASPAWSNVSPPVNLPHNTIVADPFDPNILYVGTDLGIWKSTNAGNAWTHMGPEAGMPNVAVFDLRINHTTNRLVAFTHGRGAFALTAAQAFILAVTKAGTGSGTVTSNPAGINCGADCSEAYNSGTVVTLTATAAAGSVFAGWSGDADCGDGVVTMNASKTCTATFNVQAVAYMLTVTKAGTGSGTVTSNPAGIDCGTDCTEAYNAGTVVTLTATPAAGSTFDGWSGACTGAGTCTVTMDANKTVTATFGGGAADPMLEQQWHLKPRSQEAAGANVRAAWLTTHGDGVVIGVVDDGLQHTHPDLQPNYVGALSFDFNFNDSDPSPDPASDFHGTAAAGVAAARGNNGIGVSGAAPSASLAGLRLIAGPSSDAQEAAALGHERDAIHVSSNSWGPSDNGQTLAGPGPLTAAAMETAVTQGRGGQGRIFVWAGGNGRQSSDNCNFDGYANSRFVVAIGAVGDNAQQASYSEPCSALFVTAPSNGGTRGITTTDLVGNPGYDPTDYTSTFGGTSSATPLVSGTVALMLSRNPALTWRDVKHILARSAVRINPSDSGWTGGAVPHNEKYGFGLIDAEAAVNLAATWTNAAAESAVPPVSRTLNVSLPDNNATGISDTLTVGSQFANFTVEHVEVVFNATHPYRGDLEVTLTSPAGVVSRLATVRGNDSGDNFSSWQFGSVRHWGETAAGQWTLKVADRAAADTGTWNSWTLRIFGTQAVQTYTLTVTKAGTGSGTVTSSPAGINCGADCTEAYNSGTSVTLTATPGAGSVFAGWSGGGCSGTGTCTVTMDADKAVTATFTQAATLALTIATNAATFGTGDSVIISVGVNNPGVAATVDFYFGALLPDGDTVVFFTDLAFNSGTGRLSAPATLRPIVAGVDLAAAFVFTQPTFFTYRWTGGEPGGNYVLFLAAVRPGALADNSLDAGDLVALATAAVTFVAPPDIRGTYRGSGSLTESNCQDPQENGTFGFTSTVSLSNQTGATFSGTATLTTTVAGAVLTVNVAMSGTVTGAGALSGSFTHQFLLNGVFDSSGDGTFTGQVTGNTLTANLAGQDRVGDTCTFTGSLSGTR